MSRGTKRKNLLFLVEWGIIAAVGVLLMMLRAPEWLLATGGIVIGALATVVWYAQYSLKRDSASLVLYALLAVLWTWLSVKQIRNEFDAGFLFLGGLNIGIWWVSLCYQVVAQFRNLPNRKAPNAPSTP